MQKATTATVPEPVAQKPKLGDVLVDPDTGNRVEYAKRPKLELDANKKYSCLKSIVEMYEEIITSFEHQPKDPKAATEMEVDKPSMIDADFRRSITVGNYIIKIIFTIHNVERQKAMKVDSNTKKETESTSFKIPFKRQDFPLVSKDITALWLSTTKANGLEYKEFDNNNPENWYGTMGPYLEMFTCFVARYNELRLGHSTMPVSEKDGVHKGFQVSKYGLSGVHHLLLEGTSFPPARRSSLVQSLGPMTLWLCMIRSEGKFRNKYAAAVKRAMSHIPGIDDIIELTKTNNQPSEVSNLTTLIAEILLLTTARHATRMFFPITIFAAVWRKETRKNDFCNFFSPTGAGGWYTYKQAMNMEQNFLLAGSMEEDKASQVIFHSIFGTYKEDLSILEQVTDIGRWYTREELGDCFRQGSSEKNTKIKLPVVKYYAKMSCANGTDLLSGVYNQGQVATVPCFSGKRVHLFNSAFFGHIEKERPKTLQQIIGRLITTLEELHSRKGNEMLQMKNTSWRDMGSLVCGQHGNEVDLVFSEKSKMFLG